jgi:hypothetical protein
VRADLGAGGMNLDRGDLGGYVAGQQVIDAVTAIAPMYAMLVQSAIGGLIDIQLPLYPDPTGVCVSMMGTTHQYGAISLGLGIHAVPAVIDMANPIAANRMPGTCGYVAPGDGGAGG